MFGCGFKSDADLIYFFFYPSLTNDFVTLWLNIFRKSLKGLVEYKRG